MERNRTVYYAFIRIIQVFHLTSSAQGISGVSLATEPRSLGSADGLGFEPKLLLLLDARYHLIGQALHLLQIDVAAKDEPRHAPLLGTAIELCAALLGCTYQVHR